MSGIFQRGARYYIKFRTPRKYKPVEPRDHIVLSLGTDSLAEARQVAPMKRAECEARWADLLNEPREARTERVMQLAGKLGHSYKPACELASAPLSEIVQRVRQLPAKPVANDAVTAALLGGVEPPRLMLSGLFEAFEDLMRYDNRHKTTEQYRVWRQARQRAIGRFIEVVGDMPIEQVTRKHALSWRKQAEARVLEGKVKADTANKDLNYVGAMLNKVLDANEMHNVYPFSKVNLKAGKEAKTSTREPIPDEYIRSIILDSDKLSGMNEEARDVLLVMLNTGARPSEIINLLPRHILLDADVPHISIREEGREVKNAPSIREIPLVGVSLEAMKRHSNGFPSYFGRVTSWSNNANKCLRNAGLPKPLTAYGLRHAFSDRLTQLNLTDRAIADAMGHGIQRERYGQGLHLKQRRDVLLKIAY